jgi:hypothetical protein
MMKLPRAAPSLRGDPQAPEVKATGEFGSGLWSAKMRAIGLTPSDTGQQAQPSGNQRRTDR